MSLLMDALRKAEQQKRAGGAVGQVAESAQAAPAPVAAHSLELEAVSVPLPLSPPESPSAIPEEASAMTLGDRLPGLPADMGELDEQFFSQAAPKPVSKRAVEPDTEAATSAVAPPHAAQTSAGPEAARKMFEAKHPPARNNKTFAIIAGVATLIAGGGIGAYVWWQLQPRSGMAVSAQSRSLALPPASPASASPPPAAASTATVAVVSPAASPAVAPPPEPPANAASAADRARFDAVPAAPQRQPMPKTIAPAAEAGAPPASPVRLSRAAAKVDPTLMTAYQAFNRGDDEVARTNWQKLLVTEPLNSDALHGLAALAVKQQRPDVAADYYRRVLEANPRDAIAIAAMSAIRGASVTNTESHLKGLLAENPDSPHLNFALGNLYASSGRWAEAQQAYFKAHVAEAGNPDFLFNLAVSLDQLRQPRLAADYYQRALHAAEQQPAGFDKVQAATRLKGLQAGALQ